MASHRRKLLRTIAAVITTLALLAVAPTTALAQEEPGFWSIWAKQSWKRESKAEIPFAVIVSLPPMLVCTPIWLVNLGVGAITGGDD